MRLGRPAKRTKKRAGSFACAQGGLSIGPDLVLIYEKPDAHALRLVRLCSHSELGF
jgi:mRNA-degrading endonuclease YafQ of YafQ-DinJ toxin-antitoxin module